MEKIYTFSISDYFYGDSILASSRSCSLTSSMSIEVLSPSFEIRSTFTSFTFCILKLAGDYLDWYSKLYFREEILSMEEFDCIPYLDKGRSPILEVLWLEFCELTLITFSSRGHLVGIDFLLKPILFELSGNHRSSTTFNRSPAPPAATKIFILLFNFLSSKPIILIQNDYLITFASIFILLKLSHR